MERRATQSRSRLEIAKRSLRHGLRQAGRAARHLTSPLRMLPDVLIVGAQKAGTTSLYHYLLAHPQMRAPMRKEVGFFDDRYSLGLGWYRSRFPVAWRPGTRTLEASTGYFDYPHLPARVAADLPEARVIVLLRNPVERAWSHYRHSVRLGVEPLPFMAALSAEDERLDERIGRMERDPDFYFRELAYYSYRRRGRYAEHLERWFAALPRQRILVLLSDELEQDPAATMRRVWGFLELPPHQVARFHRHNRGPVGDELDPRAKRLLEAYFAVHDERLGELLGRELPWRSTHQPSGR